MSTFWSLWIIGLTFSCLGLVLWVLLANRKVAVDDTDSPENRTTGHVYDGIEEYDNPLPRWWFNLFIGTIVFALLWLLLFPGLGGFKGLLGWSSQGALALEQKRAAERYDEVFGGYAKMPIEELIYDAKAMKMGLRLFGNNCAVCHGSDAGGNFSFPNLTDNDWLYGGTPERILESIIHGRSGNMPAWGSMIGEEAVAQVSEYVLRLSSQEHDKTLADAGEKVFAQSCVACHGAEGKGMQALGAPNLTDDIWLYSGTREGITHSVRNGLANYMPGQKDKIREEKIHLIAAYVYSLSYDFADE